LFRGEDREREHLGELPRSRGAHEVGAVGVAQQFLEAGREHACHPPERLGGVVGRQPQSVAGFAVGEARVMMRASRATLGIGRVGGAGENWSGDLCLAFSTANRGLASGWITDGGPPEPLTVSMIANSLIDALFYTAIEATEEAILNALIAAETMTGADGAVAHAIPHDDLIDVMRRRGVTHAS
jgi:Peptidase family S58